ncbi:MAG TPA: T9SS type A sorting domain-containing protein [Chitinophagaceae bacterium]|nr:T9SS type A sorting domain-containing protein [Chitinophagaceae bacterium]
MKKIVLSSLLACSMAFSYAQTAPDFTATDCNSVSHTLYNELNGGNVVVLVWVMPCASCIGGAKTAYDVAQSFSSSFPGKVKYFLIDDVGDGTCTALSGWASTNGIASPTASFGNSGNVIDEANYGGAGMPHVMVIGSDHNILFNAKNGAANNAMAIQAAISLGLSPAGLNQTISESGFHVAPNPANGSIHITFDQEYPGASTLELVSTDGKKVYSQVIRSIQKNQSLTIPSASIRAGIYSLTFTYEGKTIANTIVLSE